MGFILGFAGVLSILAASFLAVFGQWSSALTFLSLGVAFFTISGVMTPPGWAFKQAHRMSKPVWLLIAIIGLIPPFGLISCAMWIVSGRAVERAWAVGDPGAYGGYRARKAAAEAARHNQDAYRRGLDDGRRGW